MERRQFVQTALAAGAGLGLGAPAWAAPKAGHKFNLKYAPHFGMFENSAGKDLVDQLKFMADEGFTALEDNGMMGRPTDVQTKIGETLAKLGMTMGVFVVDGGDNWKTSLTTGKPEFRDQFLK
nr:twin-arginine translocation signal domain-containing protein [Bernardetiaceae bacterium]